MIRALRHLRNSTPASLSASCYDTAITVKGSSRRAVHLSGSLEEHVRLQKVLGSATSRRWPVLAPRHPDVSSASFQPALRRQNVGDCCDTRSPQRCWIEIVGELAPLPSRKLRVGLSVPVRRARWRRRTEATAQRVSLYTLVSLMPRTPCPQTEAPPCCYGGWRPWGRSGPTDDATVAARCPRSTAGRTRRSTVNGLRRRRDVEASHLVRERTPKSCYATFSIGRGRLLVG